MKLKESTNKVVIGEREKRVAVSGHRELEYNFNFKSLREELEKLSDKYNVFLIGMALGFDTACFQALEKIRENKDIKIVACIPCTNQNEWYSLPQRAEYERMINSADQVIVLKGRYDYTCMRERNRFLVDNSSLLLAYKRKNTGGTVYTVNYAVEKNVPVIRI